MYIAGTIAFSIQIYADFSGYTDIARGSAKLLGFDLTINFKAPYAAVSPSDFWRRWHISLSTWIRDYIYIPLGGSRHRSLTGYCATVMITMLLCGLWHGASWNYVLWGGYHGLLLFLYRLIGLGGKWRPANYLTMVPAWAIMYCLILFGWSIFRAPNMSWWWSALMSIAQPLNDPTVVMAVYVVLKTCLFILPVFLLALLSKRTVGGQVGSALVQACILVFIIIFHSESGQDFIYFQF